MTSIQKSLTGAGTSYVTFACEDTVRGRYVHIIGGPQVMNYVTLSEVVVESFNYTAAPALMQPWWAVICDISYTSTEDDRRHKIMLFREMQELIALQKFENYECCPTDNPLYDTVSQKTALLLLTDYLRKILYSSTKTKLGRLDADQNVRNLMRTDVEIWLSYCIFEFNHYWR